jgi:hypothetical protein
MFESSISYTLEENHQQSAVGTSKALHVHVMEKLTIRRKTYFQLSSLDSPLPLRRNVLKVERPAVKL